MPHTYTALYYHFVWATREREPLVTAELESHLYRYLRHKCKELGVVVHALNGVADHLHLVASVPPQIALSDFMHDLKGASSHFVNEVLPALDVRLYWQKGYGVLTFAKRDLPWVAAYVDAQKTRHQNNDLSKQLERTLDE